MYKAYESTTKTLSLIPKILHDFNFALGLAKKYSC